MVSFFKKKKMGVLTKILATVTSCAAQWWKSINLRLDYQQLHFKAKISAYSFRAYTQAKCLYNVESLGLFWS